MPPRVGRASRPTGTLSRSPPESGPPHFAGINLTDLEKKAIAETLASVNGNREQAAHILGIGERTLYRKIQDYGLTDIGSKKPTP
jgi:DNA-binding NtrC family response regulator